MSSDVEKLFELAQTLTDDQRRLLREGLGTGEDVDPEGLSAALRSFDSEAMFERLASASADDVDVDIVDVDISDGGGFDAGRRPRPRPRPRPEPPLTRW